MNGRNNLYQRVPVERAIAATDKYTALELMRIYTTAAFREWETPLVEYGRMREEQLLQQHDAAQRIEDESYD